MSLTLAAFLLQMLYFPNFGNCSCRPVRYFGIFFQDDITKFWDENLLLFTFSTGKLRKNLFWNNKKFVLCLPKYHNKFLYQNNVRKYFPANNMKRFVHTISFYFFTFLNTNLYPGSL